MHEKKRILSRGKPGSVKAGVKENFLQDGRKKIFLQIIMDICVDGKRSPLAAWISTRLSRKTVLEFVFDCNGKPKKY